MKLYPSNDHARQHGASAGVERNNVGGLGTLSLSTTDGKLQSAPVDSELTENNIINFKVITLELNGLQYKSLVGVRSEI